MKITQTTRYARWAAGIAIVLAALVAGVYVRRAVRAARALRSVPAAVAAAIERESAGFSFSKVEGERTLFTVRASRATQFKDKERSQLEDVEITIFGRQADRHDTIHTRQCDYQPNDGNVVCAGAVEMKLESAKDFRDAPGTRVVHVATSNVAFDNKTGQATTREAVEFQFPNGEGRSVGVTYNSDDASVRLEKLVQLKIAQAGHAQAAPLLVTSSRLEYVRSENVVHLTGPVHAQWGSAELLTQSATVSFDGQMHARQVVASGSPVLRTIGTQAQGGMQEELAAGQFTALLDASGGVERVLADGGVRGKRRSAAGEDHLQAQHAELEMGNEGKAGSVPRVLTARGDLKMDTSAAGVSRRLETAALRMQFAAAGSAKQRRIESAETLAPGVISVRGPGEDSVVRAQSFSGQFDSRGRMQKLFAHSGAQMTRKAGGSAPQEISAQEMAVSYGPDGDWMEVDNTGRVKFRQGERSAEAGHARIARATNTITLDGGTAAVSDGRSRTSAPTIEINQHSAEVHATGGVSTTYLSAGQSGGPDLGPAPAHVSAESLAGNSNNGNAIYNGKARLWQGDAVVQADQIEFLRAEQRVEATGHVRALVPQAADKKKAGGGPTIWHVTAPHLTFFNQEGRAHMDGGVHVASETGEISSQVMDLFLEAAAGGSGRRQLSRAVGTGQVEVQQKGRKATGERGEYTAADQKFFMSGGQPTITDAENGTTTGRSLTFYVASDTILVDSQSGKRTITEHRVEK